MKVIATDLPDVLLIDDDVFRDQRGFLREAWNAARHREAGFPDVSFVQMNHSRSTKHVLRGLHFQTRRPQGKLICVTRGSIFDVAVDVRTGSTTFGSYVSAELSADNGRQMWIPPGFAHGFCALSDPVDLVYLCTSAYDAATDGGIAWNDPEIGIEWPVEKPILSGKDCALPTLAVAKEQGLLPGNSS